MENNTQNNTLSDGNKEHITPDNKEHITPDNGDHITSEGNEDHIIPDNEDHITPDNEDHITPDNEDHISAICVDIKYRAVVFILLCGCNIVELDEFIYKTSDEFMGNYMIDELEFIPVLSGGFMDQEIGHDRYAETFYAVFKNSYIITNLDELNLDKYTIHDLISKKIIKMISFTIDPFKFF